MSDELRRLLTATLRDEADVDPSFLLENVPIGIVKMCIDGECLFANTEFATYLGATREQLIGDGLTSRQWLGSAGRLALERLLLSAAACGTYGPSTVPFRTKDGITVMLYSRGTRTREKDGVHIVSLFAKEPL